MSIPGFGPDRLPAMAANSQDASRFAGPREFVPSCGLTPKQNSSGGKPPLGRISKMGNRYLRKLLVVVRMRCCDTASRTPDPLRMWAKKLIDKKPFKLLAVALANKMARIAFAILRGKTVYPRLSGMCREEATARPCPAPSIAIHGLPSPSAAEGVYRA